MPARRRKQNREIIESGDRPRCKRPRVTSETPAPLFTVQSRHEVGASASQIARSPEFSSQAASADAGPSGPDARESYRILDREIRWHSLLYATSQAYHELIVAAYGDHLKPYTEEYQAAKTRIQDTIRAHQNQTLSGGEVSPVTQRFYLNNRFDLVCSYMFER